jgi:hypothetical protein
MALILDYLKALFPHWLSLMSAGPFLADRLITWLCPKWRRWLDSFPKRRAFGLWIIVIGMFSAGYLAWKDERIARFRIQQEQTHVIAKGIDATVFERDETDVRDNTNTSSLILVVHNISEGELTNIVVKMTKADGPTGWEAISVPQNLRDAPTHLNPQDYAEMVIARYRYAPPSQHIGYNTGYWNEGLAYAFGRDTPCKFAWIITARERPGRHHERSRGRGTSKSPFTRIYVSSMYQLRPTLPLRLRRRSSASAACVKVGEGFRNLFLGVHHEGTAEHDRLAQRPAREQQETHCAAACLNRQDRRRFVAACQPGQLAGGDRPLLSSDNR